MLLLAGEAVGVSAAWPALRSWSSSPRRIAITGALARAEAGARGHAQTLPARAFERASTSILRSTSSLYATLARASQPETTPCGRTLNGANLSCRVAGGQGGRGHGTA